MRMHLEKFGLALVLLGSASLSNAAPVAYTSQANFLADLGPAGISITDTLDFDTDSGGNPIAAGTIIQSGVPFDGFTFSYTWPDVAGAPLEMIVTDFYDTTSGFNSLGTTDGDLFLDGDEFSISFAPSNAFGMLFITADPMLDGDITLTANGVSASLAGLGAIGTVADGSEVFFLGLIDTMNPFTQVDIGNVGGGFFFYNVDDIVIGAVPVPAAFWLFGTALAGFIGYSRRRTVA